MYHVSGVLFICHDYFKDLARILRPLVTFAEQIFFFIIMNKQEYNGLNLIIS